MQHIILFFLVSFILGFGLATPTLAQDNKPPKVTIELYADVSAIAAGDSFTLGIEQNIIDEWHTYWKNPGDSGAPTKFYLTYPEGVEAGDIQWPVGKRIPYGPLMNYGYEGTPVFLQKISIPSDFSKDIVRIDGEIEWLVCKEICIPEYQEVEIEIPVLSETIPANQDFFAEAQSHIFKNRRNNTILPSVDIANGHLNIEFDTMLDVSSGYFLPEQWGIILNAETQNVQNLGDDEYRISIPRDTRDLSEIEALSGYLVLQHGDDTSTFYISLPREEIKSIDKTPLEAAGEPAAASSQTDKTITSIEAVEISLLLALGLAFLGGMILNLMPCVFPVLSMKALSLVKAADKPYLHKVGHGLTYTIGVVLSFVLIAGVLLGLQAAGSQIGWGFQLQNPIVTGVLAYLLFIVGLNLAGFFEFGGQFAGFGQGLTQGGGYRSSFFTGVLATLVATPCTAPFMATALGFALTQPPGISLSIFAMLGFGLAFPYLLLTFLPGLQRVLPRPGAWMDTFKQFLAFPMFASALWLAWVFSQQGSDLAFLCIIGGAIALAWGIWMLRHLPTPKLGHWLVKLLALVLIIGALVVTVMPTTPALNTSEHAASIKHNILPYTPATLEEALRSDNPVFVEMTAAWCITCQVNKRIALDTKGTKAFFADNNITYIQGDWTNQNATITQYLKSFGRNGVPLYVYYREPNENGTRPSAELLPQILTEGIVKEALN